MKAEHPKIRSIEALPMKDNQIYLRDPLGFSDKIILISYPLFFICTLFDGKHSLVDVQKAFKVQYGQELAKDDLVNILNQLDECLFLENERFSQVKKQMIEDFKNSSLRKNALAGVAYEEKTSRLYEQLDNFFTHKNGAGALNAPSQALPHYLDTDLGKLKGVLAPHIDLQRGGPCYTWSYSALAHYTVAKTFIILGISHAEMTRAYALTRKDFETPLGTVSTDNAFIDRLVQRCTTDFFVDEYAHRNEHSIEFQTLFLRYLYPPDQEIKIVPILCSSFHPFVESKESPIRHTEINEFIEALKQTIAEYPGEVCLIAGVDLSHIGRKFGHDLTLSPALIEKVKADDYNMLKPVLKLDAEEFFKFIRQEEDARNICGVPAIYTLLKVMQAKTARLLNYDMAVDQETQSLVSFVSAAFFE
jgi:hypothetical protein